MNHLSRDRFRALFTSQRDRIHRLLRRLGCDQQEAEDLLQDTFLTVWRKRDQFEGRGAPEGYLVRTCMRLFINTRQRSGRRPASQSTDELEFDVQIEQPTPAASLERRDALDFLAARVEEALETLAPETREAFILFRYEDLGCAEIAEIMGAPLKTVESRVRRATLHLAECLRPHRAMLHTS